MSIPSLLLFCSLLACTAADREPSTPPTVAAVEELGSAFGIHHVSTGCRSVELHAENAARTRSLDIDVDAMKLALRSGTHRLSIKGNEAIHVAVVEYAGPRHGETECTDAVDVGQPTATNEWRAIDGELALTMSADANETGDTYVATVELVGVVLRDGKGHTKRVHARFADVRVGWYPG
jgi:hypothetical protein